MASAPNQVGAPCQPTEAADGEGRDRKAHRGSVVVIVGRRRGLFARLLVGLGLGLLSRRRIGAILDAIEHLDRYRDVRDFIRLLCP